MLMENQRIAKIFSSIGEYLAMGDVPFKPQAYQKAAAALDIFPQDVREIYEKEGLSGLKKVPGIGESLAEKIREYLETGHIKYYDDLRQKFPVDIFQLTQVEGIGPKTVKKLYQSLGVKNLDDLDKVARQHKIKLLAGFGEQSEQNILRDIAIFQKQHRRFLLGKIFPIAQSIKERLEQLPEVEKVSLAGSIRRRKETIGDVDILAVSQKPKKAMKAFLEFPGVVKVWGTGLTKSSIRLQEGFDIDLRIVKKKDWGSALQYFTGSKQHNIVLRKLAIKKGLKLNEYGVFRGEKRLAGKTEEGFYRALKMDWIPPELRTNHGEIEASRQHRLPVLINYGDLKGDLHVYSNWGLGKASIEEMARAAKKQGYHYIAITDQLRGKASTWRQQLKKQGQEIEAVQRRVPGLKILKGIEMAIPKNGKLNFDLNIISSLDIIVASVLSFFQMPRAKMTERILNCLEYPFVNILAHPTNRLLYQREASNLDLEKIFQKAREKHVLLEINSQPERLDLADENIRRAIQQGVGLVIDSEAHFPEDFRQNEFGLAQARRGWANKADIVNTQPWKKISAYLKRKNYES